MNLQKKKQLIKERRKARVLVRGTAEKPRLSVFRSLLQISAQIINDEKGLTIVSASSKDVKAEKKKKSEVATEVGKLLAERAKAMGVTQVAFDRNSYRYHGRIKALADGARDGGLKF
jgi:large subunit ribosomal protein L18